MSLNCPSCTKKAKCVNSRPTNEGTVNRRYNCVCGARFTSVEVVVNLNNVPVDLHINPRAGTVTNQLQRNLLRALLRQELGDKS